VLASLGEHSEFEHLEKILLDAICTEPVDYDEISSADSTDKTENYKQYETKDYTPTKHEYIE
jgi:cell filamentation protein